MAHPSRAFWPLLGASVLSDVGGSTLQIAILLQAFHLTDGSVSVLGINAALVLVPAVAAAPIAGVLVRRHAPRQMMLISDLMRAGCSILLHLVGQSVLSLLTLQVALSLGGVLYGPARQSLMPQLIDAARLHAANAAFATASSIVLLIGPVVGSLLYAGGGVHLVASVDASLYLAAAAMLLAVKAPAIARAPEPPPFFHQVVEGFALIRNASDLRRLIILTVAAGASVGLLVPLLRPFVEDVLHGGDRSYGLLMGAFGLGCVVGPTLALVAERRLGLGRAILIGFALEPLVMLAWTHSSLLSLSLTLMFLWGVVVFALVTCQATYVQQYAPRELLSSAFAILEQAGNAAQLLAALLVILLAPIVASRGMLGAAALAYLAVALLTWWSPGGQLMLAREASR